MTELHLNKTVPACKVVPSDTNTLTSHSRKEVTLQHKLNYKIYENNLKLPLEGTADMVIVRKSRSQNVRN